MENTTEESNVYFSSDTDQRLQRGGQIRVKDPKKTGEGRDAYICYIIELEGATTKRRYSEFESFRDGLCRLNPTCLVPPLPEKNALAIASLPGNKNLEGSELIEKRRKGLESFLNRIARHPILSASTLFHKFLEVENWTTALNEELGVLGQGQGMFSNFASNLSQKKVQKPEMKFVEISHHENNFCQHIMSVDRNCRRLIRRQNELASDFAEFGSAMNNFSLTEKELGPSLEKFGATFDSCFLAIRFAVTKIEDVFLDPLQDYILYVNSLKYVLSKRDQQQVVVETINDQMTSKRTQLKNLENEEKGIPVETGFFKSFSSSITKMLDSNPEQTRKDNIAKLQKQITEHEEESEKANSQLVKTSEAILFEYKEYEKRKAVDMKNVLLAYVNAQIELYQKVVQAWGFVIPVIDEIPTKNE